MEPCIISVVFWSWYIPGGGLLLSSFAARVVPRPSRCCWCLLDELGSSSVNKISVSTLRLLQLAATEICLQMELFLPIISLQNHQNYRILHWWCKTATSSASHLFKVWSLHRETNGFYSSAFCCAGLSSFFIPSLYSVFSFDQMSSLLPTLSVSVLFSQSCLTPFASFSFVDGLGPSGSAIVALFGVCTNTMVILCSSGKPLHTYLSEMSDFH